MAEVETMSFAGFNFTISGDDSKPVYLALGVRKSGSSIMNAMMTAVAEMNGVNYVDIPGALFHAGVSVSTWQADTTLARLMRGGNLYGGFRNAPRALMSWPRLGDAMKILLVRDPRDALVSEYFSNAYSHSLPIAGNTRDLMMEERRLARQLAIEDYVFRMMASIRDTIRDYEPILSVKNLFLYKYEQAIMDKRWFLRDVCGHFGWTVTDHQLELIMSWADVMPESEVATDFIRKVVPGDHREKLSERAIERLNRDLRHELALLGYA